MTLLISSNNFVEDIVQEIVNETNLYKHEFSNSTCNVFPMQMRVNEGQSVAAEEIRTIWTIFMLMDTVQKPSLRLDFS
jgi:phage gp16-like protein